MSRFFFFLTSSILLVSCSSASAALTGAERLQIRVSMASSRAMQSSVPSSPLSTSSLSIVKEVKKIVSVRVPILVYHHVRDTSPYPKSTWSYKMSVSPAVFESQMKWLVEHGYKTMSMDDAVELLQGRKVIEGKPVVITFDDNNLNAYNLAVPIMKKHGLIATFYIITNRLQNPQTIDASRVKELSASGMDIQSHSVTHSIMTYLSSTKLETELHESKKTLEDLIGKPVRSLAYPLTSHNKTVREAAKRAGYTSATIMDPRPATDKDDLYKLPRIMMTDDTKLSSVLP